MVPLVAFGVLVIAGGAWMASRAWGQCRHRFGLPVSGRVRCMRCTRSFAIDSVNGEFRISKRPLRMEPPAHPPA